MNKLLLNMSGITYRISGYFGGPNFLKFLILSYKARDETWLLVFLIFRVRILEIFWRQRKKQKFEPFENNPLYGKMWIIHKTYLVYLLHACMYRGFKVTVWCLVMNSS